MFLKALEGNVLEKDYDEIIANIQKVNVNDGRRSKLFFSCLFLFLLLIGFYYETHINARNQFWQIFYKLSRYVLGKNNSLSKAEITEIVRKGPSTHFVYTVKKIVKNILASWAGILLSYNGILAATLILFYSIKDNKKDGIPNRRIMAFAYGSHTAPILFGVSMIFMPIYYLFWHIELYFIAMFLILYISILQLTIMNMILKSTSHMFHNEQIKKIEKEQLRFIIENKKTINKYGIPIWTYFTRYMSEALSSVDLLSDQIVLVREILFIPFEGIISVKKSKKPKRHKQSKYISFSPNDYYYFYYNNLSASFKKLSNDQNLTRATLIDTVKDFITKLLIYYLESFDTDTGNLKIEENTVPVVVSSVIKSLYETSWNYHDPEMDSIEIINQLISIINIYIKEGKAEKINTYEFKRKLLLEYVLFQGYLESKQSGNTIKHLDYLNEISLLRFNRLSPNEQKLCFEIWDYWAGDSIRESGYFKRVVDTYEGNSKDSYAIVYILNYTEGLRNDNSNSGVL